MPRPVTALLSLLALLAGVLLAAPAQAASRVTIDAGGEGAAIDSSYSTRLKVQGSGFQSVQGGHGGIYVWFGTVNGTWRPSQGGQSGTNYLYVPDSEAKDNAGFQRFVAFPGSDTADSANGGVMARNGSWSVDLTVPGPTFQAVGRNGKVTQVDCRKVTCGVITVGAHGVKNARNETFTPVRVKDLQRSTPQATETPATGESPDDPSITAPDDSVDDETTNDEKAAQPKPAGGPAELTVDHTSAYVGRAMSFTVTGLTPGEQFTVVLDDGLAAVGPFLVGQDGSSSGVISIPTQAGAGTHELRLFGASKEASVKFGVQDDPAAGPVAVDAEDGAAWLPIAFAGGAAVVFLVALVVALLRIRGGRRATA